MSRYLFAIVLAMGILFAWQILFPPEQREVNGDSIIEQNNNIQSNIINIIKFLRETISTTLIQTFGIGGMMVKVNLKKLLTCLITGGIMVNINH